MNEGAKGLRSPAVADGDAAGAAEWLNQSFA